LQTFQEDVLLLWRNALVYNQPTSPVYKFAAKLQNVTDVLFKGLYSKYKVACIEDKAVFAKVNEAGEAERSEANQDNVGAEEHLESAALKSSWFDQNQILIAKGYEMMDLCVVCSSRGSDVDLIYCSDCGQCFHYYCLGIGIDAGISLMFHESIDSNEVGKNSSPKFALAKSGGKCQRMRQLKSWRCPNCTICEKCGRADKSNQLLQCDTCDSGIHLSCHRPALSKVPDQGYRCEKCVKRLRCRSCDINLPYSASAVQKWRFFCSDSNFWSLCGKCVSGYQERKFCPICLMVWKDSDGDML
jgi:histone-lysine N-methyltransferase MLL3